MKHQLRQWYYRICLFLGIYKREDFVKVSEVVKAAYRDVYAQPHAEGLCISLSGALLDKAKIIVDLSKVQRYIPKFTRQFVGAPKERLHKCYWWSVTSGEESRTVRLDALQTLFNYYYEHDELILKGKKL